MKNAKYIGAIPDQDVTSASRPVSSYQSFTERMKLDRQRRVVKGYRDSHLGSMTGDRNQIRPPQRQSMTAQSSVNRTDRQAFNSRGGDLPATTSTERELPTRGFIEPSSRGYNPFQ